MEENQTFPSLSKKETAALLYTMRSYGDYSNLHIGVLPFIKHENVVKTLKVHLGISQSLEAQNVKPSVSVDILSNLLSKFDETRISCTLNLDQVQILKKAKSVGSTANGKSYQMKAAVRNGRMTVPVIFIHLETNTFLVKAKRDYFQDVIEWATYNYGCYK